MALGSARLVTSACGVYHDDGIYVATAKALAEGRGYRLINLPGEPPQTKYPFLFPAALACLWWLWPSFPHNLVALQGFSLLSGALAVALSFDYFSRHEYRTRRQCLVACVLCATSPTFLYFGSLALSEAFFALLLMVAVVFVDTRPLSTTRQKISLGALAALPFLARSVGLCVPAAIALMLKLRSRPVMLSMLAAAVTASTWVLWVYFNSWSVGGSASVYAYYTADNYRSWWLSDSAARVPFRNLVWIITGAATVVLPILTTIRTTFAWPLVLVIGACVWVEAYKRYRASTLGLIIAGYVAIIVVWPWPPERFLVPLMPVLAICLVGSAMNLASRLPGSVTRLVLPLGAVLAIGANVMQHAAVVRRVQSTGYPFRNTEQALVRWADYEDVFQWLRTNTPSHAIVASGLDSMVFLYADRQGFRPFVQRPVAMFYGSSDPPLGSLEEFTATLKNTGVDFVLEMPMPEFSEEAPLSRLIHETRADSPGCLDVVYSVAADPRFVVYSVNAQSCGIRAETKLTRDQS